MEWIQLNGMHFFAYHGLYGEESILGNDFVIDISIKTSLKKAGESDSIKDTVNYETIYKICDSEMQKRSALIENIGYRIKSEPINAFGSEILALKLLIKKEKPPLPGKVDHAALLIEEDYQKKCARCGSKIVCYSIGACWCKNIKISTSSAALIKNEYNDCLCKSCLSEYRIL